MKSFKAIDMKEESDVSELTIRIMSKVKNLNDVANLCMETSKFSFLISYMLDPTKNDP